MNPPAVSGEPVVGDGLVVVHARDQVNSTLAGHDGCEYTSPPQARGDALALVALLLGHPTQPNRDHDHDHDTVWRCPVAGGQRTISLTAAPASPSGEGRQ
jgi:hypothetical protein